MTLTDIQYIREGIKPHPPAVAQDKKRISPKKSNAKLIPSPTGSKGESKKAKGKGKKVKAGDDEAQGYTIRQKKIFIQNYNKVCSTLSVDPLQQVEEAFALKTGVTLTNEEVSSSHHITFLSPPPPLT